MPRAATEDGAAVNDAAARKREQDYPDVEAHPHAKLLSTGEKTYGFALVSEKLAEYAANSLLAQHPYPQLIRGDLHAQQRTIVGLSAARSGVRSLESGGRCPRNERAAA